MFTGPQRNIVWWYWLATLPFTLGAAMGCRWSLLAAGALTVVQAVHFGLRTRSATGFSVQVRLGYLGLLLLGAAPAMGWIHWVQTAGTSAMVLIGYCPLARLMSLLPWNRAEPMGAAMLRRTLLSLDPRAQTPCGGTECTDWAAPGRAALLN